MASLYSPFFFPFLAYQKYPYRTSPASLRRKGVVCFCACRTLRWPGTFNVSQQLQQIYPHQPANISGMAGNIAFVAGRRSSGGNQPFLTISPAWRRGGHVFGLVSWGGAGKSPIWETLAPVFPALPAETPRYKDRANALRKMDDQADQI